MAGKKNDKNKAGWISHGLVAENRRARFDYEIGDTLEAGIVLTGTEVKSLRLGKAQIAESYASPEKGELWLINSHIPEYLQANRFNHAERRPRKLLVSKKQLARLDAEVEAFHEYMANLNKAKDREEFDRFMNEYRGSRQGYGEDKPNNWGDSNG